MLLWISVVAVLFIAFVAWQMIRRFGSSRLNVFNDSLRSSSRLVTTGELVDGSRRLPVTLTLTKSTLSYESSGTAAHIDLRWITEIDYVHELANGAPIDGREVLRLRSSTQTYEFVLAKDAVQRWHLVLSPRGLKAAVA